MKQIALLNVGKNFEYNHNLTSFVILALSTIDFELISHLPIYVSANSRYDLSKFHEITPTRWLIAGECHNITICSAVTLGN